MAIIKINNNTMFVENGYIIDSILAGWLKIKNIKYQRNIDMAKKIKYEWYKNHSSKIKIEKVENVNIKNCFLLIIENEEVKVINTSDNVDLKIDKFENFLNKLGL